MKKVVEQYITKSDDEWDKIVGQLPRVLEQFEEFELKIGNLQSSSKQNPWLGIQANGLRPNDWFLGRAVQTLSKIEENHSPNYLKNYDLNHDLIQRFERQYLYSV